jgi:hypothetical protein
MGLMFTNTKEYIQPAHRSRVEMAMTASGPTWRISVVAEPYQSLDHIFSEGLRMFRKAQDELDEK